MPLEERLRFDNHQRASPIKESGQRNHCQASCRRRSPPFRITFLEQGQLFSEKEALGDEGRARRPDQGIKVNNFRFYNALLVLRPDAGELGSYFFADDKMLFLKDRLANVWLRSTLPESDQLWSQIQ